MAPATVPEKKNGDSAQQHGATALAPSRPNAAMTRRGIEPQTLEEAYRFATALSRSTIVPKEYQNNPDNCLIAIDVAARTGSNWLAVMQHVFVVHGRPGFDANFAIGLVNQSCQFDPIQYEVVGDNPRKDDYRVRAYSTRKGTTVTLYGPWIDWPLVRGEGWDKKDGSKWKTMPDQMFHYRAGSWWQKRHCPEMTLGMPTTDELEDSGDRKHVESTVLEPTNGRQPFGFNGTAPTDPASPSSDPTDPTPEPDSTVQPTPNVKPRTMYRCLDGDCESKGAPFDKPTKVRKTGQLLCPHCASERIEPVQVDGDGVVIPEQDPAAALDQATAELQQQSSQPPAETQEGPMRSRCVSPGCGHRVPQTAAEMKGKPCPKCGSGLGYKNL